MRYLRALIALLLLASGCGSRPAAPPAVEPLRAMTFNIRYGTASDGDNAWQLRRPLTFRVIREYAPAVVGVQEALRFQLDEIRRELPQYGEIGVGRDDGEERGEYSAILYDERRLTPLESGTFWLSDSPQTPGSKTWGNNYPRIVTWARFRDREHGTFYVFNTHWDHESQPSRERSAALTRERIRTRRVPADPVLLMGDFNAGESNPAFRSLLADFSDTFRALHPGTRQTGTFHAFRGDRSGEKIDAILASPEWQPIQADIVLLRDGARFPSDHYPVTATLVRRARAPPAPAPQPLPQR